MFGKISKNAFAELNSLRSAPEGNKVKPHNLIRQNSQNRLYSQRDTSAPDGSAPDSSASDSSAANKNNNTIVDKVHHQVNKSLSELSPRMNDLISRSHILPRPDSTYKSTLLDNSQGFPKAKDYHSLTAQANKALAEEIYREIASKYIEGDFTEEEKYQIFCQQLDQHAQNLFDFNTTEAWTRLEPDALLQILKTGVFKSLVEIEDASEKKRKLLSANTRIKMERQVFGYPENWPSQKRPYYGYPSNHPYGKIGQDLITTYGPIALQFKKTLIGSGVTIAADDTAKHSEEGSIRPAPWQNLHRGLFALKKYEKGELVNNYQNPLKIKNMHDIDPYPELQIHPDWIPGGRLTLKHVNFVVFDLLHYHPLRDDAEKTKNQMLNLIQKLEDHQISYHFGKSATEQQILLQRIDWLGSIAGSLKYLR